MRTRCHWWWASFMRRSGVVLTIVVCVSALSLAGSPKLHELLHYYAARPAHSCAITLPKAAKCVKVIESLGRRLVWRPPAAIVAAPRTLLTPAWIPRLFLEACRFEYGPPMLC
jgi:hypothetical protein